MRATKESGDHTGRPMLRDYLWGAWYAKLWWTACVAFCAAVCMLDLKGLPEITPWFDYLVFILFMLTPPGTLFGLLFLFARATFLYAWEPTDDEEGEDEESPLYDGGNDFGFHQPRLLLSNPRHPLSMDNQENSVSPLNPTRRMKRHH